MRLQTETPPAAPNPPARAATDVEILPVRTAADRRAFIEVQYRLYDGDPYFVPPLEMDRRDFFDPKKHPWYEHGHAQLFIARRNGQPVGRIAALEDPRLNAFQEIRVGLFGFFECIDDPGVAKALFDAAATWVKGRGFSRMMGPIGYSSNYELGTLVEGFDASPALMMAYNPRYHPSLYEACGLSKEKDLYAWELSSAVPPPEKVVRIAERIRAKENITVRPVNLKNLRDEIQRVKTIYNSAWEKNWGFVPMTEREFDHMAQEMRLIVRPELLLIAEVKGEPVAFSMTLPDANAALKAAGGRLTTYGLPIGLVKMMLATRKLKRLRLLTLGIKEGFRRRGLDAILYLDTLKAARELGYSGGEISWTLEDNHLIHRAIENMGGRRYKTYRIYARDL